MRKFLIGILLLITTCLSGQIIPGVIASSIQGEGESTLNTGIVAYWKLDEDSGTTLDDAVGTKNGTAQTGVTVGVTGKIDDAVEFTSTTADVYIPQTLLSGDKVTFSMWFYLDQLPSTAGRNFTLLHLNHGVSPYYTARIALAQTTNYIYFRVVNTSETGYYAQTDNSVFSATTWYNLVCVCNGSGELVKIYLNGSDVSTTEQTFSGTFFQNNADWSLGNTWYDGDGTEGIDGKIDEFGMWSRALTTDEITELYNSGSGKTYPF